ncbi:MULTISPECIES: hypothetical protein [Rhizobium]|uniref:Uncharacterized protein n=1 Tax=Rhizobium aouanii TaxID=3118145 RepID=A0ABU8CLU5_9HYPH|nr:hypothetical protein [Rhizobium acaciae]MCW1410869.1 hypothetical protein [Rhizobium acaciae]MCW1742832.1 hypothetical protein [Rhizobium acaciae]MCW1750028.1 hypothetical protein [Rhizobium acaciae]
MRDLTIAEAEAEKIPDNWPVIYDRDLSRAGLLEGLRIMGPEQELLEIVRGLYQQKTATS